jgi:NitT/TauT family transport system substrate-binding protein
MEAQSRREFLRWLYGAGTLGFAFGAGARAEPPPEVTRIRLAKIPGICIAPQYIADDLLRAEGFTEIDYVLSEPGTPNAVNVASGKVDFSIVFIVTAIVALDLGNRLTMLGGVHPGCFELFVKQGINRLADLKGKSIGIQALGSSPQLFLESMAAYVGLDPMREINWVTDPDLRPMDRFLRGEIDAFLGFPPEPQELRAKGVGRVLVNSALDQPWSQYFCCLFAGNSEFVQANPVASKRALRAILKAADLCVAQPASVARILVDRKFTPNYDYALEALGDVPYRKWRDYDAEDAVRFYALRLREAGVIQASPQEIIAKGTDWRFAEELKRELKS